MASCSFFLRIRESYVPHFEILPPDFLGDSLRLGLPAGGAFLKCVLIYHCWMTVRMFWAHAVDHETRRHFVQHEEGR